MRIVAHVGVKDEVELIERTIAHLWAIGVDHIIVIDDYSTDGTTELLEKYRSRDDFWFERVNATEQDKSFELVQKAKADWAIYLDADEFWLPATGSLKECISLPVSDSLRVDRFNVPLGPDGPYFPVQLVPSAYDDALLFDYVDPFDDNATSPWISGFVGPKVMVRPDRIRGLTIGNHESIAREGDELRRGKPTDLLIAHLPFTTKERFRQKVRNIREFMTVHKNFYTINSARHWRHWLVLEDQGRLDEEFDRQVMDQETIASWRARGAIRSAAEMLKQRMDDATNSAPSQ